MKSFSIRKATNPNQLKGAQAQADQVDDSMKYGYMTGDAKMGLAQNSAQPQQPSLLSQEEQEALKPKDVKVENPWIYEQTH